MPCNIWHSRLIKTTALPYTQSVPAIIVETDTYRKRAERLLAKAERERLREFLAVNPATGDVIPGLGGLRKMRMYLFVLTAGTVILYSKTQKEDLTNDEKKQLRNAAEELKRVFR